MVPIIGGARLSGKINRTNVGLLSMFTEDVASAGIEKNNFTVARVNHEFKGRSALGALVVNKASLETGGDYNRTFALDGKLGLGPKARLSGFYAATSEPKDTLNAYAFKTQADYIWNQWELQGAYTEVGQGFNPEVGFLVRTAFRKAEGRVLFHYRPKNPDAAILELRPHISYQGYWNFNGFQETGFLHMDNHWEFKSGLEFHTGFNLTTEGVSMPFEIANGVFVQPGTYKHAETQLVFMTNESKPISVNTRTVLGGSFGGSRYITSGTLRLRGGDKLNADFTYEYNNYQLPVGDFTANIFRSQISYAFSPDLYLQSLVQNNSTEKLWTINLRFGWLQRANTGLFIVYNHNLVDGSPLNQSLIIKYSHMFDLVK